MGREWFGGAEPKSDDLQSNASSQQTHRAGMSECVTGDLTLLEGITWFTHTLSPQWYWGPISDYMIHRIHERVLNHIKRTVEGR